MRFQARSDVPHVIIFAAAVYFSLPSPSDTLSVGVSTGVNLARGDDSLVFSSEGQKLGIKIP